MRNLLLLSVCYLLICSMSSAQTRLFFPLGSSRSAVRDSLQQCAYLQYWAPGDNMLLAKTGLKWMEYLFARDFLYLIRSRLYLRRWHQGLTRLTEITAYFDRTACCWQVYLYKKKHIELLAVYPDSWQHCILRKEAGYTLLQLQASTAPMPVAGSLNSMQFSSACPTQTCLQGYDNFRINHFTHSIIPTCDE